jgi:outer membrane biosynthesis protein TonB
MKSQEEQKIRAQAEQVRGRLQDLEADLRVVDDEFESLAPQRLHHELLDQACGSLEKLGELGAASLFWGEQIEPPRVAEQLRRVRDSVSAFQAQLGELEERRQAILTKIGGEEENLEILGEDLYDLRQAEERRKLEWVVERDISPVPRRVQLMAWARGGEDDRRFHQTLAASMLVSLLLGVTLPMIDLPLPKRFVPEDMPKRLAQLVRPAQAKPLPKTPSVPETPPEQQEPEQQEPEPVEEPKPSEQPPETPAVAAAEPAPSGQPGPPGPEAPVVAAGDPRKKVGKAGILAFRDKFASLARDEVAPRLGADARYGDADDVSKGLLPTRSMLTTNAPGSSGGINLGSLSRNVGGSGEGGLGGAGGIHGVQVGRATSAIASIGGGGDRPRARGGPGPSRTDEEIQIVFDRYKASFYRLYNRELRKDPTLQGQMVLRLTIEPDGSVSMCMLQSSDMDAPDLAAQVVNRVRTINFGAKEDVQALTIVYPIDFLPAA